MSFFDRLFECRSVQFQTNLRTNEDTRSFQRGPNSENTLTKFKKLPQNHWANINDIFLKTSFGERKSIFVKVKGHTFFEGEI